MGKINKKSGFTLFELLVTISIVAILTAVAVVSYGGLNKKTRDSRRMADMEKIRISLEAARQIGYTYPTTLNALVTAGYLDRVPVDPKGTGWSYYFSGGGSTYTVCAQMEDVGSTNIGTCGPPDGRCGTSKNCNYRVRNP